jgi:flagellar hook-associated protein 2
MATVSSTSSATANSAVTNSTIDVASIVSQLMQVESQPLTALQTTMTGLQTTVSAFGQLQSLLATLQDSARALTNISTWQASTGTSADDTAVSVTAAAGAPSGDFNVEVDQLAQPQTIASDQFDSGTTVIGGGTLRLQMGSFDKTDNTFTADPDRHDASITIPAGATLSDIRTAINSADIGVTATLVNDGGKVRLMVRSSDGGVANGFRIQVDNPEVAGDTGLSSLTFDPTTVGAGSFTMPQSGQDAQFSIGGLALTSTTNHVQGVLDSVTLDLKKVTTTPVDVQIGSDSAGIRKSVDTFVAAYNKLNSTLADLTKYDATTKVAGTLQGNSAAVMLQSKLRQLLSQAVGTGTLARLSDAGIAIQRDGSLLVDDTKFASAAADPKALRTLFANGDADNPDNVGIASRFNTLLTQVLGTDGSIGNAVATLQKREADVQQQEDDLNVRLAATQTRLTSLYTQLDSDLANMNSTSQFLTSQLAKL